MIVCKLNLLLISLRLLGIVCVKFLINFFVVGFNGILWVLIWIWYLFFVKAVVNIWGLFLGWVLKFVRLVVIILFILKCFINYFFLL